MNNRETTSAAVAIGTAGVNKPPMELIHWGSFYQSRVETCAHLSAAIMEDTREIHENFILDRSQQMTKQEEKSEKQSKHFQGVCDGR